MKTFDVILSVTQEYHLCVHGVSKIAVIHRLQRKSANRVRQLISKAEMPSVTDVTVVEIERLIGLDELTGKEKSN